MSMLTPPEMGGEYRIKGNKYPKMRRNRRRRKGFVLLTAVLVLALAGWGTWQLVDVFSSGDEESPAAARKGSADCRRESRKSGDGQQAPLPRPGGVKVNVLNATARPGLAQDTADELEKRGFKVGRVANAPKPYDKKVPGPGVLLGARTAEDGALQVLGTQLQRARTKTDTRTGAAVDLIIGDGFTKLAARSEAAAALRALSKPSPTPTPTCG